jgi:two-component system, OmpR family, sensor kinase
VRRLLRNLLENAQRYNQAERGQVALTLARDGAVVVITVRDHGSGVLEGEHRRIFEPFYRAQNASERDGGVGLGLALVQSIAQRHGGNAVCVPTPEQGGYFVVRLKMQSN